MTTRHPLWRRPAHPRPLLLDDDGLFALSGYRLPALAIDRLVGVDGVAPLAQYAKLRRDLAPGQAFEAVFGRTLQVFSVDFALWRRTAGV